MSGGHFDYQEAYLGYVAEQLQRDIEFNDIEYDSSKPIDTPHGFQLEPETIKYLKTMVDQLQKLHELLHAYDYAVSSDTKQELFLEKARAFYQRDVGDK